MEEKIIVGSEFPLNGLLTVPEGFDAPYPAVVFVHGSGGSDMDSKVYNVKPFKDMAEGLAKHGIASIRYDKRTFVHGKKFPKTATVWEETIEDALFATMLLRKDSRIDPKRVFIAGLSLGATLAPRIDVEGGKFAGLIILAGTPRRLEEVMKSQGEDFLRNSKGFIKWIAQKQIKKLHAKFDGLYDLSDEDAKGTPFIGGTTLFYLKDMGKKQVREFLEESTTPVLVMQGDADFHLDIEKDFNEYKDILTNHPDATFKLYPGINHVFMPKVFGLGTKAKQEYSKPQNVEKFVIDDIAEWIGSKN